MPAAMAAAAICPPGSAIPGVPASLTTAIRAPCFQLCDELFGARALVVHVVADGGSVDLEVVQQLLRLARVFAGDAVYASQHAQGSQGDVLKIADWRGYEVEARRKRLV